MEKRRRAKTAPRGRAGRRNRQRPIERPPLPEDASLVEWSEYVGFVAPSVPPALIERVVRKNEATYASRELPMSLYDIDYYVEEVEAGPVDDYIAIGQAGHGINSSAITYALVFTPIAVFVQCGWGGGVDADEAKSTDAVMRCSGLR